MEKINSALSNGEFPAKFARRRSEKRPDPYRECVRFTGFLWVFMLEFSERVDFRKDARYYISNLCI